jgi:probable phosphoglycerate mutase
MAVYASPARRVQETAAVIAARLGVDVVTMPELVEWNIGECDGRNDTATHARCYDVVRAWILGLDLDARITGGESGRELCARFSAAPTAIAAAQMGSTAAVVSHVAAMTAGLLNICDNLDARTVWRAPLPHAVPLLVTARRGTWECGQWPAAIAQPG